MTLLPTTGSGRRSVTVPRNRALRPGRLDAIVSAVATFVGLPKQDVRERLFG